ncbi:MAG TPA: DUF4126 family protein [Candidatus Sulfomarinibacteraceae bacterium]|nr:DUF4126 family protein [Candidatus Sulfomarinibacteraceae bacterium]
MNRKTAMNIIGLGIVAGMRTMSAPAFVARAISKQDLQPLQGSPLRWLGTPTAAALLKPMAAGELVGDKLPFVPNRTNPGSLAGRMASGALVGATIARLRNGSAGAGALLGAASAAAGAIAAFHTRRALGEKTGLPDALLALGEDALVLALGNSLTAEL